MRSCHSPPSSGDSTMLQGELGDRAAPSNTHVNSSHRLHPSKSRRISDVATLPSQLQRVLEAPPSRYFSPQARSSQVSRRLSNTASRVPVGTVVSPDGHIGIPPVPALRPVQFNGVSCTRPSSSSGSVASATAVTESTAFTASPSGMSGIVLAEVSSQFAAATGHERDETVGGTAVTNPPAHLTPSIQGSHPSHAGQQQSKKATDPEPAPPMGAYSYMPRDFATARLMPPQRPRQISGLSMAGSDYSTNLEILPPSVESVPSTRSKPIKTKAPPQRKQWFFKGFKAAAVAV